MAALYRQVAASGLPHEERAFEYRGFSRGVTYWHWTLLSLPDGGGEPPDLMLLGIEMTEEILSRQALDHERLRFRATFEQAAVGMAHIALDGRFLRVNRRLCEITGYTEQELLARTVSSITHPDDLSPDLDQQARLVRGEVPGYALEKRYLRPDGSLSWIYLTRSLVRDATGAPDYYISVVEDISARKGLEAERERTLAELEAIITSIADAVVIFGPDGEILRMNPAAQKILGYSDADLNVPWMERFALWRVQTPDGRPVPLGTGFFRGLLHRRGELRERLMLCRDDSCLWVAAGISPLRSRAGGRLGLVATFTDLTPLRVLQQQRQDLLQLISQDLITPLTVIQGHAQMLEENLLPAAGEERVRINLEAILAGTGMMDRILGDLSDTAALESGLFKLTPRPVGLTTFLRILLDSAKAELAVQRVEIEVPAKLPTVWADEPRLQRIFYHLLGNALKFSPAESRVRVSARAGDTVLEITVTDAGPGVDPTAQNRPFEPFPVTREGRSGRGIGLGLHVARLLIEAHGGEFRMESAPGQGNRFIFTLPLAGGQTGNGQSVS